MTQDAVELLLSASLFPLLLHLALGEAFLQMLLSDFQTARPWCCFGYPEAWGRVVLLVCTQVRYCSGQLQRLAGADSSAGDLDCMFTR